MDEQRYESWLKNNGITAEQHLLFYKRAAQELEREARASRSRLTAALVKKHVEKRKADGLEDKKAGFLSQAGEVYVRFLAELQAATAPEQVRPSKPPLSKHFKAPTPPKGRAPETITLNPRGSSDFPFGGEAAVLAEEFAALGFEDVGVFAAQGLADFVLHLVAHDAEQWVGVIYAHPEGGVWADVLAKLEDGTLLTATSSDAFEHGARPQHTRHSVPGAPIAKLCEELRALQGKKPRLPLSAKNATMVVEQSYADETAWRKQTGVTTDAWRVFA